MTTVMSWNREEKVVSVGIPSHLATGRNHLLNLCEAEYVLTDAWDLWEKVKEF